MVERFYCCRQWMEKKKKHVSNCDSAVMEIEKPGYCYFLTLVIHGLSKIRAKDNLFYNGWNRKAVNSCCCGLTALYQTRVKLFGLL